MRLALLLALAGVAGAQSIRVSTEFERIDPFGNVVEADRAAAPREVLSPALARNAFTTFQVVVEPGGRPSTLFIAQNPEGAVDVTLYRAVFRHEGNAWIPDRLVPVKLGENGEADPIEPQVPGQKVLVYWMDVWVRPDAPVRRSRLELQVASGDRWTIYPLELRAQEARPMTQPAAERPAVKVEPAVSAPSSASALWVLRAYACGAGAVPVAGSPGTVRGLIRRNALQDQALARSLEHSLGRATLMREMLATLGARDRAAWCRDPKTPPELGAEWVLRVRDYLYKAAAAAAAAAPQQ
jgi:hypothetical protein